MLSIVIMRGLPFFSLTWAPAMFACIADNGYYCWLEPGLICLWTEVLKLNSKACCVTVATLHQLQQSGWFKAGLIHRQSTHISVVENRAALIFLDIQTQEKTKKTYSTISAQNPLSSFTNHLESNLSRWYLRW